MNSLDALQFSSHDGLNALAIDYRYRVLTRYFEGASCLELGCADGRGIRVLVERFERVVAVDGSKKLLDRLAEEASSPRLTLVCSMFEDLGLEERFDTVLLGHILEHVDDPARVVAVAKRHLKPGGVLIADVPNADSIHREMGVKLGMLAKTTDLNDADRSIGHQRVYQWPRFRAEFESQGLTIERSGGYFLKPLSNAQLEKMLTRAQIDALFELGHDHPEIAADIFVVCRQGSAR
jgi:2-polyprenyl-3-methyl-5-hydroxy-6-metoxy-1,4-benzoquinol methylase